MSIETHETRTPTRGAIRPRRLFATPLDQVPRHWCAGDPLASRFLDTLSLSFPDGELFFVESVRRFKDQARDARHAADIAGFVGQETQHSLEHERWNRHVKEGGFASIGDHAEGVARKLLRGARKRFSAREQLGATAALEHVTAVLARGLLDDAVLESFDPGARPLWLWHAIEELEHKSVAFDLHVEVGGTHRERQKFLVLGTLYLVAFTGFFTYRFLEQEGLAKDPRVIARGLYRLFGPRGLVSRAVPDYLDFFRPGFHPDDHDTDALLASRLEKLDAMREALRPIAAAA